MFVPSPNWMKALLTSYLQIASNDLITNDDYYELLLIQIIQLSRICYGFHIHSVTETLGSLMR